MAAKQAYLDKFISDLDAGVAALKNVAQYKGEFETDSPYDPHPPEVFVRFEGTADVTHTADQKIGTYGIPLTLFICALSFETPKVLDIIDAVEDFLDGKLISPTGINSVNAKVFETKLLGYMEGGLEVYQMSVILV